jgi:hypothetical protein
MVWCVGTAVTSFNPKGSVSRLVSCYCYCRSLSSRSQDKNSVASFVMEDVAVSVSLCSTDTTSMVAVTGNGVLLLYRHQLNG